MELSEAIFYVKMIGDRQQDLATETGDNYHIIRAEAVRTVLAGHEAAAKERNELRTEVERMREALLEAAETVQEWGSQAPDYAQEKWGLAEEIERIRAAAREES